MKEPAFWYKKPGMQAQIFAPLGKIYAYATMRRLRRPSVRMDVPVICVGNINAGGTGKTPTVHYLTEVLKHRGHNPAILTRGYRGRIAHPILVNLADHSAMDVGDEAIIHAAHAPTIVSKNRALGAALAVKNGADVIVMDDGFQSPDLHKDISLVVVDAARGFGNGLCIPAGPLREPIQAGLARADAVLTIGPDTAQQKFTQENYGPFSLPHVKGALEVLQTGMPWKGLPAVAFAGIGHPARFFNMLRDLGVDVRKTVALADHAPITPAILSRLIRSAHTHGAQLLTTEKDAARLNVKDRQKVLPVPVRLRINAAQPLIDLMEKVGL